MHHHTPEQQRAYDVVDSTLTAWLAALAALNAAEVADDDEAYAKALGEALRAEREVDGAWAHYHAI